MHRARLFVVCGLPGSGKTTRALQFEERFGAVRLSADDLMEQLDIDIWDEVARARIEAAQTELAERLLRLGTNVVVEWGSWARSERDALRALAERAGAHVHLDFLDPPLDVLWDRVEARGREQEAGHRAITRADMDEWSSIIQRPTPGERALFDPLPPLRAGEQPSSAAFPYGTWRPQ